MVVVPGACQAVPAGVFFRLVMGAVAAGLAVEAWRVCAAAPCSAWHGSLGNSCVGRHVSLLPVVLEVLWKSRGGLRRGASRLLQQACCRFRGGGVRRLFLQWV